MDVFFSIITVSYNSEKTIERTIKSVLNQSFQSFEYIIVDGASRDETMSIVKTYEEKFMGRMHYVSEPDKGIYDAMNKGIQMAHGEIVGIVNSDDWLDENALEVVYKITRKVIDYKTSVYTGDIRYYYIDGTTQVIHYSQKDLDYYAKRYRLGINHPATFVPLKLYQDYGIFDINIRLQADSDFVDRLYHKGVPFVFIDSVLSNQSDGGASTNSLHQSLRDYKYILRKNEKSKYKRLYYYSIYKLTVMIKKHAPAFLLKMHRGK